MASSTLGYQHHHKCDKVSVDRPVTLLIVQTYIHGTMQKNVFILFIYITFYDYFTLTFPVHTVILHDIFCSYYNFLMYKNRSILKYEYK